VVDWFYREAAYGNDLVLYTVDNDEGDIWIADLQEPEGGYYVYPDQDNDGDQDFDEADQMLYHTAAANREEGCLDALDDPGHHYEVPSDSPLMVELDAGTKFAFYLQQGSVDGEPAEPDHRWFPFSAANVDDWQHFEEVPRPTPTKPGTPTGTRTSSPTRSKT